jgi:hypothetical protein
VRWNRRAALGVSACIREARFATGWTDADLAARERLLETIAHDVCATATTAAAACSVVSVSVFRTRS